jgi:hypothetical protein
LAFALFSGFAAELAISEILNWVEPFLATRIPLDENAGSG